MSKLHVEFGGDKDFPKGLFTDLSIPGISPKTFKKYSSESIRLARVKFRTLLRSNVPFDANTSSINVPAANLENDEIAKLKEKVGN